MNFPGPKYHISGNCFMYYLQSQIISFCHSRENYPKTVHASSSLFIPGLLPPDESCSAALSTVPRTKWGHLTTARIVRRTPFFTARIVRRTPARIVRRSRTPFFPSLERFVYIYQCLQPKVIITFSHSHSNFKGRQISLLQEAVLVLSALKPRKILYQTKIAINLDVIVYSLTKESSEYHFCTNPAQK